MKNTISAPKMVRPNCFQVTKVFAKNAMIFGTPEYKLWREVLHDCPEAQMVTKRIKKNPNKKNDTKNMTYEHMAIYIREQNNADVLMLEFKKQIAISKIQTNPYRSVLAWFKKTFENYDDYKMFFEAVAKQEAQKNDIFTVVKSAAIIEGDDSAADEYDLVSEM